MRKRLNNYFDVSKREFNGLMILVVLIIGVLLAPVIYRRVKPFEPDAKAEEKALMELEKVIAAQREAFPYPQNDAVAKGFAPANEGAPIPAKKPASLLFPFDPNTTDRQGWQQLGFSEKQAQVILNYIHKGGKFRKAEDLQKMYVISPAAYEKLKPYVVIKIASAAPVTQKVTHQASLKRAANPPSYKPATAVMVEINSADSIELDKIRGIGPAFARRIIKYRERIGGFYKKEQLMEVYGLDSLKFIEIKDQVKVDATAVKKVNINTAKVEDFKNHPYIRYKQVHAIIQYRIQHGNYGNFADLKNVAILTPDLLERLAPYITFSP
jgi:competence protein ComEA